MTPAAQARAAHTRRPTPAPAPCRSISNKLRVATRTAATKAAAEWSVSTAAVFVFRDVRDGLPEGFPSSGKVHSLMLDHDIGAIDLRKTQYKMIEKLME
jgi:hypothetical protein